MSKALGKRLAELRNAVRVQRADGKETSMWQEEVAAHLGVKQSAVSQWETGATAPSIATLGILLELYQLPAEEWSGVLRLANETGGNGEPPAQETV